MRPRRGIRAGRANAPRSLPDRAPMLFPTVQFAIFFPVVLAISWALMSRPRLWKPFIVFASYVFYAGASWRFCLLLGGVTIGNQIAARLIGASEDERRRKRIVVAAVTLDLFAL